MSRILLQLDVDPQPSVFDAITAIDAGVNHVLRHGGVRVGNVRDLIHGAMFTRGGAMLRNTAVFVGGSDANEADHLLQAVVDSFFGKTRVSVMLDASGANTTAAAAVLAVRRHVPLVGGVVTVLGGTGPVGLRAVRLLAAEGAQVRLASRKLVHAEAACDKVAATVSGAQLKAIGVDSPDDQQSALEGAQAVVASGAAGVELLGQTAWQHARNLKVAVDLNAVPPVGIAAVDSSDDAVDRRGVACYGALAIGAAKMKIHKAALARLFAANDLVLDGGEIYELGKELER